MFRCKFVIPKVPLNYIEGPDTPSQMVEIEGMLPFVPWEGMTLENFLVLRGDDDIALTVGALAWRYDEQNPDGYFHSAACEFMGQPATADDLETAFKRISWTTTVLR